ncbi:LOW QUALITY PROTEIN: ammonium transporter 2 member 5-like [Populus alba]|uniref:LOW QUALITY PROTEIN: ammonium transporter 2 member 5-like n=1 Tax=Populus alba TaxID=43335 RepID=UPI003CC774B1
MSNIDTAFPPNLLPDEASPEWFNKADNAWQLTAAALVGLQSIPGLMILYGGGVKEKMGCEFTITWGYRMSFGSKLLPFWGEANVALDQEYLLDQAFLGKFPNATMVYFRSVFAAITLILIAGAVLGRMNIYAWMIFVPQWLTFSYTFTAFSVWCPDGFLAKMGLIDYSGGYVIHLSSGLACYTAAYWVGPRLTKDRERFPPNNILLMLFGAGLLWMGWTGFNGGDPYVVSNDASLAVLNTHLCTATSCLLTWVALDIIFFRKASAIGAVQGMITGLVCITPAAGKSQIQNSELLQEVDDTMAVLHTHAIAGSLGGILTGLFAEPKLNRLFFGSSGHYIGLFYGFDDKSRIGSGVRQMGVQFIGILFVVFVNVVTSSIICILIRLVVPLRMSNEDLEIGDDAAHGEEAYATWGNGERQENSFYRGSINPKMELSVSTNRAARQAEKT